ncbi:MAG: hypothetical protein KDJ65_38625, partial [Anaerolineae bacterium]|nr:hypothetical protein [Anaerolineae bacterium]
TAPAQAGLKSPSLAGAAHSRADLSPGERGRESQSRLSGYLFNPHNFVAPLFDIRLLLIQAARRRIDAGQGQRIDAGVIGSAQVIRVLAAAGVMAGSPDVVRYLQFVFKPNHQ